MKNICIFYFDQFWAYEVGLALNVLKDLNIFSAALEDRIYISEGKQKLLPDRTIAELNPDEIDLFIIPGGNTAHLFENTELKNFLYELNKRGKLIAGVCGGTLLMIKYGLLNGKKVASTIKPNSKFIDLFANSQIFDIDFMMDGNLITAPGEGFMEFGIELGKIMGVYISEEEALEDYAWRKNIRTEHLKKLKIII
jgi:putative intracellular protease/amidase